MAREFCLPDLGEGIAEAQIVRVLIKPGDHIELDQYLMEVETDKAAVEIPSPYSGVATAVHVAEGDVVGVGTVVVTFDDNGSVAGASKSGGEAVSADAPTARPGFRQPGEQKAETRGMAPEAPEPNRRRTTVPAAPAVRKVAREMGIDLETVTGTGPGGRITREDLKGHAAGLDKSGAAPARQPASPARPEATGAAVLQGVADTDKWGPIRRLPLNQIRKTIANRLALSASTVPHVTHIDEADITELDRMRRGLNEATGDEPKITPLALVVRATCLALRKYQIFNASFDEQGGQIIYKNYINMGIAVDTERGLIVPVIRNADRLSLRGIAAALRSLADRIRSNQFAVDDLRGGTFSITNVGAIGGLFSTPIINHPEVAILALGRSHKVPVISDGRLTEALKLPLCVSFDHRATDGADAARFTREIVSYLETPAKFLLD